MNHQHLLPLKWQRYTSVSDSVRGYLNRPELAAEFSKKIARPEAGAMYHYRDWPDEAAKMVTASQERWTVNWVKNAVHRIELDENIIGATENTLK